MKALLDVRSAISASLLYPREPVDLSSTIPRAVLTEITSAADAVTQTSPAARPCLARTPAATTTTSSPCRATPAPSCKRKLLGRDGTAGRSRAQVWRRNNEQRVQVLRTTARACDQLSMIESILVEAGAGSGTTAVVAGRIAVMSRCGRSPRASPLPRQLELAASELLLASGVRRRPRPAGSRLNCAWRCQWSVQVSATISAAAARDDDHLCRPSQLPPATDPSPIRRRPTSIQRAASWIH